MLFLHWCDTTRATKTPAQKLRPIPKPFEFSRVGACWSDHLGCQVDTEMGPGTANIAKNLQIHCVLRCDGGRLLAGANQNLTRWSTTPNHTTKTQRTAGHEHNQAGTCQGQMLECTCQLEMPAGGANLCLATRRSGWGGDHQKSDPSLWHVGPAPLDRSPWVGSFRLSGLKPHWM